MQVSDLDFKIICMAKILTLILGQISRDFDLKVTFKSLQITFEILVSLFIAANLLLILFLTLPFGTKGRRPWPDILF